MPVYLYRNLNTNETFELEQRITESALTVHPETGDPVKRLIQPVGIAFKGSGFYVNDSRTKNSASSGASKPEAAAKSETAKDTKSDGATSSSKTDSSKGDSPKGEKRKSTADA